MNFEMFLRDARLIPGDIVADAKWRRCRTEDHPKKKNGTYKLLDSGTLGFCQNFAVDPKPRTWKADGDAVQIKIDHNAIERRRADERRTLVAATQAARKFYRECQPLVDGHPYLTAHQLDMTGCYGLRIDPEGWLVVPVLKDENLMSVQRISPAGEKRFWPGTAAKGGSYPIERRNAGLSVVCEGLATGLSIYAATPLARVLVAFNAGNLARIGLARRGMTVVAADNDHETERKTGKNPGIEAANEAAKAFGCGVAVPKGIFGTDWCDYRNERLVWMLADRPKAREGDLRRAVDAEIAAAMMRNAVFLHS